MSPRTPPRERQAGSRGRSATERAFRGALRILAALGLWLLVPVAARSEPGDGPPFEDVTEAAGLEFRHHNGYSGRFLFVETIGSGAALLDFDGDGDLDLFLVQGGTFEGDRVVGGSHRLFRHDRSPDREAPPRFLDPGSDAIDDARCYGMGTATGDVDDDGWTDLYVTCLGPNMLLRNRGDGTFARVAGAAGADDPRWSTAASFLDAEGDGDLDLFVGNYVEYSVASDKPCFNYAGVQDYCSPTSYDPLGNRLFRNRGDGTFEDASVVSGIGLEPASTLGSLGFDADGTGRPTIYEANDAMANRLWVPADPKGALRYEDQAALSGCAVAAEGEPEGSMGVVADDLDRDGHRDLFVTHLRNEKNTYYAKRSGGYYEDRSYLSGLGSPSWTFTGFGAASIDLENDGWPDLAVVNGAVTIRPELAEAGDPFPFGERNQLFRNRGDGTFEEIPPDRAGGISDARSSRGLARGDLDRDGDADLVVSHSNDRAQVLSNRWGDRGRWIGFLVRSARGVPRSGFHVTAELPGSPGLTGWSQTDGSYLSSHDPAVILGLGERSPPTVTLAVPGERRRRFRNLRENRYYVVPGN